MRSMLSACGAAAALAFASSAVASSTRDVIVTNDPSQPVPVTGAVNATVTGSVNASITGAVNANVTNDAAHPVPVAGTVTPSNTAATPLFVMPANASARQPFQLRLDKLDPGLSTDYTVPAGVILVLEAVHVEALVAESVGADSLSIRIRPPGSTIINGPDIRFLPILLTPAGRPGAIILPSGQIATRFAVGSLVARAYASAGETILVGAPSIDGFGGSGHASAVVTLTGYLVPADSPTLAP